MLKPVDLSFSVWFLGEWIMGTIIGEYIGTTIGIHSPIPYKAPDSLQAALALFASMSSRQLEVSCPAKRTPTRSTWELSEKQDTVDTPKWEFPKIGDPIIVP